MKIILSNKYNFQIDELLDVSKIEYDKVNHIYNITFGIGIKETTETYDSNDWIISILVN